ncbi:MAG: hypothetical protein DLM60_22975 [Pseudonocardiales bacterium]|nr:hypothetical protein [Actinomycetota bacterium]PZS12141.1 MAG: hypothetical protein DLM60_22975 [Pseudonocardiales bacterium]
MAFTAFTNRQDAAHITTRLIVRRSRRLNPAAAAHLCGVAPIPARSGKTRRHRLRTRQLTRHLVVHRIGVRRERVLAIRLGRTRRDQQFLQGLLTQRAPGEHRQLPLLIQHRLDSSAGLHRTGTGSSRVNPNGIITALMALPSFRTVDPGRERLVRLSLEDCHETAPLPGPGEGLTSRRG